VLGHELARTDSEGRAVAIEAIFGCGSCEWCRRGSFNLCTSMAERTLGVATDGGMSEYSLHRPPAWCPSLWDMTSATVVWSSRPR